MRREGSGKMENENQALLSIIRRYEKVLRECIEQRGLLDFLTANDWAISEDYFVHLAKEALQE
jgi:hypothetical protein